MGVQGSGGFVGSRKMIANTGKKNSHKPLYAHSRVSHHSIEELKVFIHQKFSSYKRLGSLK